MESRTPAVRSTLLADIGGWSDSATGQALASVGYNWTSTNIAVGPPVTGCWWDPWYGYICSGYQPTHGGSTLTYQAGVGVQYNFSRNFAIDADYKETWIQLHNASGTPGFGSVEVMFIFRLTGD